MKKRSILTLILTSLIILSLTSCRKKNLDTFKGYINDTLKNVEKISESFYIYDDDFKVYSIEKSIEILNGSATITSVIEELSSTSYQLETTTEVDFIENIDKEKIISLNLNESCVKSYEYKNDVLSILIENSKISSFFNGSLETSSDINLTMTFKDKALTGYSFECTLNSGRIAKVSLRIGE